MIFSQQVRSPRLWFAVVLATLAHGLLPGAGVSTARGQSAPRLDSRPPETEVAQTLAVGEQLERDRRWSDALLHYEQAVRNHPGQRVFQDRLLLAKAHFDCSRRYTDRSFLASVDKSSETESLEICSEVLNKINTHYVQVANWHDLIRHGTFHWEVALTEPVFLRRHVPQASAERVNACRREVRQLSDSRTPRNKTEARDLISHIAQLARQRIGLPPSATIFEYTCGAMNSLDDYSNFLTGDQLDEVFSQIEGNFVGLGVELKAEAGELQIVSVIGGSPAEKGGLRGGEKIVAVDGRSLKGVPGDTAADLLKGVAGSTVTVEVVGAGNTTRTVRLLRERIEVPSVEDVKIVDREHGTGYLKLTSFQKTTSRDVDSALWKLHREGMRALIIDVRGNPGGLLPAAVEVADKFIGAGTIVMTRGRSPSEDFDYKAQGAGTWRVPLVVLIDGDSASASEIFAGAIRDHKRGTIVGRRSYGKGSVQGIFPLSSTGAGVRLTTAKFFSPSGQEINKKGVSPDVAVQITARPVIDRGAPGGSSLVNGSGARDDQDLAAAVQVARQQSATATLPNDVTSLPK